LLNYVKEFENDLNKELMLRSKILSDKNKVEILLRDSTIVGSAGLKGLK
jgi:hypothetical protein